MQPVISLCLHGNFQSGRIELDGSVGQRLKLKVPGVQARCLAVAIATWSWSVGRNELCASSFFNQIFCTTGVKVARMNWRARAQGYQEATDRRSK